MQNSIIWQERLLMEFEKETNMYLLAVLFIVIVVLYGAFQDDIWDWIQEHPVVEVFVIIGTILLAAYGFYIW